MSDNYGMILIFGAPSGAGKSTIVKEILKQDDKIKFSVSVTTRTKRNNEIDGSDYHFISKEQFDELLRKDDLYEHAQVFANHYGTPKQEIEKSLKQGIDIILDIDWQGAIQVKQKAKDNVVSICIVPPSYEILKQRLNDRKLDTQEVIDLRMNKAKHELQQYQTYDYLVINDDLKKVVKEIQIIIDAERKKSFRNRKVRKVVDGFLDE